MVTTDYIRKRLKAIRSRPNWESHWEEVATYVLPRKAEVLTHASSSTLASNHGKSVASNWNHTSGRKRQDRVFDSTAIRANEDLASALHGMLTNPATLWFELSSGEKAVDERTDTKLWLQEAAKKMHTVFNNTNFQSQIHELYLDLGCFGTAGMYVEEDPVDVLRFEAAYIPTLRIAENYRGVVDTIYREMPYSYSQIAQKFPNAEFSKELADLIEEKPFEMTNVWHMVEPRQGKTNDRNPKHYPIASIWFHEPTNTILHEGGFLEMPWSVPRWTKTTGESYGRSPAMKALPDIKMINAMSRTIIKAAEKAVDPPLLVNSDGQMSPPRTFPGGLNYIESQAIGQLDPIRPLQHGGDIRIGMEEENQRRDAILRAFFNDQLNLAPQPNMTATEVIQRQEEKLRQLGPMLGRLQDELLRPLINRTFAILLRAGYFPEMPQALAEVGHINVRYSSPIAKTQRITEAQGLLRWFEIVGPVSQAMPQLFQNVDPDELGRGTWSMVGLPAEWLKDPDQVAQERAAQQQQMQQQQELEQNLAVAEAASKMPEE